MRDMRRAKIKYLECDNCGELFAWPQRSHCPRCGGYRANDVTDDYRRSKIEKITVLCLIVATVPFKLLLDVSWALIGIGGAAIFVVMWVALLVRQFYKNDSKIS